MNLANSMVINIYSMVLLIIILLSSLKQDEKDSLQYKLYMSMIYVTFMMLILDILSRFDGNPSTIYPIINQFGNFLVFLLSPVMPSLWLLYVHDQVYQNNEKTIRILYPLIALNIVNVTMVIISQFFGWFYYIDVNNIYHRGPLYFIAVSMTAWQIFIAFVLIVKNRKKFDKKHFYTLAFFAMPPCIGIMLQIIFYGTSVMLNGVVLSLLILCLNIQSHSLYMDYLTGVNNRKRLDLYLKGKISTSAPDKTFSAIMIDLNDFKFINDTFGHDMGDFALQASAKLLQQCLKSKDFIARFGGDEFCIVLEVSDGAQLDAIACRINKEFEKYNEYSNQPYHLGVSMGYAVYDYDSHMDIEEFQKKIDLLMYENKQLNKKEIEKRKEF